MNFKLHSQFKPTGDQPQAIEKLTQGLNMGLSDQVLLGVTGSGKTFTMANIIANVNRPDAGPRAQQDAGCAAVLGIPGVFPGKRRGILHFLLRLLPA